MRKAKVVKFRGTDNGFGTGKLFGFVFGLFWPLLRLLVPLLPFVAIWIVFSLPKTPHLRVSYTYTGSYENKSFVSCKYLGVHGFQEVHWYSCPLITMMKGKS